MEFGVGLMSGLNATCPIEFNILELGLMILSLYLYLYL